MVLPHGDQYDESAIADAGNCVGLELDGRLRCRENYPDCFW